MGRNKKVIVSITVFLFFLAYIFTIGHFHKTDPAASLTKFLGDIYTAPVANDLFGFVPFFNKPVMIHIYMIVFLLLVFCALAFRKDLFSHHFLLVVLISTWMFVTLWQNVKYVYSCKNISEYFEQRTTKEKYFYMLKKAFAAADIIQNSLIGQYNCKLLTDMDTTKDPGMYNNCAMAYFMYPTVDIWSIRGKEKNCLFFFEKDHAHDLVPPDHHILINLNNKTLLSVQNPNP